MRSPFISVEKQHRCREIFSDKMFEETRLQEVIDKTMYRDLILDLGKQAINTSFYDIKNLYVPGALSNEAPERLSSGQLDSLSKDLINIRNIIPNHGRINYQFMPPDVKEQIDIITDRLINLPQIHPKYDEYCSSVNNISKAYSAGKKKEKYTLENAQYDLKKRLSNILLKAAKELRNTEVPLPPECQPDSYIESDSSYRDYVSSIDFLDLPEPDYPEVVYDELGDIEFHMEWSPQYKEALNELYEKHDYEKAMELLSQEYTANNVLAIHDLGKIYELGLGTDPDLENAQTYYEYALDGFKTLYKDKPSPYIAYRIGKLYNSRKGTPKDIEQAKKWFIEAKNNPHAQYSLAKIYMKEWEMAPTPNKAEQIISLLHQASSAEHPNLYAAYELGRIFEKGDLAPCDLTQSQCYYQQALQGFLAVDKPDDSILYRIGKMYQKGQGTEPNESKAIYYLEQSAEVNNVNAIYDLSKIYLHTGDAEKQTLAIQMLKELAQNHHAQAQYALGKIFSENTYAEKDIATSISYFRAAADQGNDFALYSLGKLYLDSEDTHFDFDMALSCLACSAAQGNQHAAFL